MQNNANRVLFILLLAYCGASLIHFIHNAEFLQQYPGLPATWSRFGVYLAWAGMTVVGGIGSMLYFRGHRRIGLAILAVYAALGLDSLGHYIVAPLSAHTAALWSCARSCVVPSARFADPSTREKRRYSRCSRRAHAQGTRGVVRASSSAKGTR
jgi:hypothetical protein